MLKPWAAAADLQPGDIIHGLHGVVRVESVEGGCTAKTRQIVIDGFQNAFLGPGAMLGSDHAPAQPDQPALPSMGRLP